MPSPAMFKLSSGREIPWLAFGNGSGAARHIAAQTTLQALEAGFTHIDTAQGYKTRDGDSNEAALGDAIQKSGLTRKSLYIVTKISQEGGDASKPPVPLDDFLESVKHSIKNLRGEPDLVLIHSPMACGQGGKDVVKYWQALEKLIEEENYSFDIGISNFFPEQIEAIAQVAKIMPVCHQLEMHPMLLAQNKRILELHEKYNIRTAAYGPLSPLLRHEKQGGRLKTVLDKIAERHGVDASVILLKWCKAEGIVAVTTSSKQERIAALARIDEQPDLSKEEVEQINKIGSSLHFRAYDEHLIGLPAVDLPSE